MDEQRLKQLLQQIRDRELGVTQALEQFKRLPFEDLGFAKIDHHRAVRRGMPEVIFAPGKKPAQLVAIIETFEAVSAPVLITRLEQEIFKDIESELPGGQYHEDARIWSKNLPEQPTLPSSVAVLSAGTSDQQIAAEAVVTLRAFGAEPVLIQDVGVAGIHRLFAHLPVISEADVVIVVAGMDGALPSVASGLIDAPVIAVPTSTGYGANLNGFAALLTMINSCSSGVTVVNIDNGFGAAYAAGLMIRKIHT